MKKMHILNVSHACLIPHMERIVKKFPYMEWFVYGRINLQIIHHFICKIAILKDEVDVLCVHMPSYAYLFPMIFLLKWQNSTIGCYNGLRLIKTAKLQGYEPVMSLFYLMNVANNVFLVAFNNTE